MKSFADLILSSPFFEHFPEADRQGLPLTHEWNLSRRDSPILRENDRADVLYMLVVGKVRLFFEMPGTSSELGVPGSNSNQAGLSAGRQWSNLTISALAPALEDCQLLAFDGLMEYGSIFGHGAYLGPELHRRLPPIAPRRNPSPSSDNDFFMAKALKIKTDSKWWPVNEGTNKQSKSPSKVR